MFFRVVFILFGVGVIFCYKTTVSSKSNIDTKPNVLIVFPDQLRRYSAGYWSESPYKNYVQGKSDPVVTPNIDKLATQGVVFTNAISNFPLCSPYRGMLLSGKYPQQNGIWNNCKIGRNESLKDDVETIPDLFFNAGYNTAYFGKCHWLRNDPLFDENGNYVGTTSAPGGYYINKYDTYIPAGKSRHNIEYFYQALKDEHFNPRVYSNDPAAIEGKRDGALHLPKVFSAKNEAEKIIEYLKNERNQRDANKPFCLIWSMNPPHNPWNDANTDMEQLNKHYGVDTYPEVNTDLVVRENADVNVAQYARHYFANVTSVDMYLGHVLQQLENMGELENTIVIFSSDHGEMMGSHGKTGKNTFETESLAIPFIVHWPKGLSPGTSHTLFSVPDVLPTVMGLAGLGNYIPDDVEGINHANFILSESKKPKAALLMLSNARGVLTEKYTLCLKENGRADNKRITEAYIYDNVNDPYQLNKIGIAEVPSTSKELLKHLANLLEQTNDPWYQTKKYSSIIPYK